MKKTLSILFCLVVGLAAFAVPAKRQWRTVEQSDGTTLRIALVGDERLHYYATADGLPVVETPSGYCYAQVEGQTLTASSLLAHEADVRTTAEQDFLTSTAPTLSLRRLAQTAHKRRLPSRLGKPNATFEGSKKAPVILATFSDKSFAANEATTRDFYDRVLNEQGFNQYGAPGSVHDYFTEMSRGTFDLTFDVIGPVRVSKSATYYGGPSAYFGGTDHIGEFISEVVTLADAAYDIDWTQYDWDGDGEVEQVFVLYAGYGQATGGPTGTIWPNAWTLDEALQNADGNGAIDLQGTIVNQYACSNELYSNSGKTYMGLGVFCHEFSHCMGLPDMYDTNYGSTPTMGDWDLLASGSYNGPNGIGWCPPGWTSYERSFAGWLKPIELQPGDTISGMKDLQNDDANAYAIYNDGNRNEFYLLENHTQTRWDAYTPESGLLIIHVDYDSLLFANNIVNTRGTFTPEEGYSTYLTNDHPRMAPFSKVRSISNETYYYTFPMLSDRISIDSLTDSGKPNAALYNENTDGSLLMHKPIRDIRKADNGDISFVFMPQTSGTETAIAALRPDDGHGACRFYTPDGRLAATTTTESTANLRPGLYILHRKGQTPRKIVVR